MLVEGGREGALKSFLGRWRIWVCALVGEGTCSAGALYVNGPGMPPVCQSGLSNVLLGLDKPCFLTQQFIGCFFYCLMPTLWTSLCDPAPCN